jgi:tetratricopeptide (TPR) repeat protein
MFDVSTQTKQPIRRRLLAGSVSGGSQHALYEQCLASVRSGNIDRALGLITRACSAGHVPAQYHRVKADLLWRCGKFDQAIRLLESLIEQSPKDALSHGLLGDFLAERKEFAASKRCYEAAIALDPTLLGITHNLATVQQLLGHAGEAETLYRRVIARTPHHVDANLNLAVVLNALGRYQEGLSLVEGVVARSPQATKAYVIASAIELNSGHSIAALTWIEKAIAIAPDQTGFLTRRANILSNLGHKDLALADCNSVLDRFPNDVEALQQKASVLRSLHRADEALDSLLLAESLSPDPASVVVDRAWILAELGRKDQALELLDKTLAARPNLASALDCRAFLTPLKPGHADLAAMEDIVGNRDAPIHDRIRLSLSVGRTYLNADDGAKAFRYLNLGNGLRRNAVAYERAAEEQLFADVIRLFSAEDITRLAGVGIQSATPIFVFGMPRSGTTLVEQILASHHRVQGTGETPYLDAIARTSIISRSSSGLTPDNLLACGNRYLELISAHAPAATRFVDKTNSNFLYAGLISLLFPRARMIHCRRDPLDTCLSLYSLLFDHGHEFSYDLADLGHYYGLYRRIMAHWRNLLGPDGLLEIDYELLVDDTEAQVGKILNFCEFPWDDACLRFHETERLVTTSSFDQVRSPIYKKRVGRAEKFRPWLGPLVEALENSR